MKQLKTACYLLWKFYVGLVFVTFALALYPFFKLILFNPKWKKAGFYLFLFWSWMMRIFCFYHVHKVEQAELPKGPYIIISNHSSYLDIFLMPSILPKHPFLFLGKGEIVDYPIVGTYFKGLNIPVYRKDRMKAAKSFIMARKSVMEGWSVVIFPEGGIPDENLPQMMRFKSGAFKLAKSLNVPIVPVTFTNNYRLLSDPDHYQSPARPGISRVYIHPYISTAEIAKMDEKELLEYCYTVINEPLVQEHPEMMESKLAEKKIS